MIKEKTNERTLTPQEVRSILKTDNKEIVELCKKASIRPKKNEKGYTYFSYDEVKNLRKVQAQMNGVSDPITSKSTAVATAGNSANPAIRMTVRLGIANFPNFRSNFVIKSIIHHPF